MSSMGSDIHEARVLNEDMGFHKLLVVLAYTGFKNHDPGVLVRDDVFLAGAHRNYKAGNLSRLEYHDLLNIHFRQMGNYVKGRSGLLDGKNEDGSKRPGRFDGRKAGVVGLTWDDDDDRCRLLFPMWWEWAKSVGLVKGDNWVWDGARLGGRIYVWDGDKFLVTGAPDVQVLDVESPLFPRQCRIELKTDISLKRFSLKAQDIKAYTSKAFAPTYILTFFTDGFYIGPEKGNPLDESPMVAPVGMENVYWAMLSPEALSRMCEAYCEDLDVMGDKKGFSICGQERIERFMTIEEWGKCRQRDGLARPWEDSSR